jgi:DNA ligase-1
MDTQGGVDSMWRWADTAEQVRATRKTSEKVATVAAYLRSLGDADLAIAVVFLGGRPFPEREQRTTGLGWRAISVTVQEIAEVGEGSLRRAYDRSSDLGIAVGELLAEVGHEPSPHGPRLSLSDVASGYVAIAEARSGEAKRSVMAGLLTRASPLEARYVIAILGGELRIGLREGHLESAVATAFGRDLAAVEWAGMLSGDTGRTAVLARHGTLASARLTLFHPLKSMLASPVIDEAEALSRMSPPVWVEDKYDGIRAQLHKQGRQVRLFSRDLNDVTTQFPEVVRAAEGLSWDGILDGELLAWKDGSALPFLELQSRLGRKAPSAAIQARVPVIYVAFDALALGVPAEGSAVDDAEGPAVGDADASAAGAAEMTTVDDAGGSAVGDAEVPTDSAARGSAEDATPAVLPLLRLPLRDRRARLEVLGLDRTPGFGLAALIDAADADELTRLFVEAQARGNEGLVLKDPDSTYAPGRRGYAWLKLKKALTTLDCMVVGVEVGHGRRHGVLSDYTFAVRDDRPGAVEGALVTIGKAYSGLSDAEIAEMTRWFEAHTITRHGRYHVVEPSVVVEIAFDAVHRSARHASGYALRFPRIVRLRDDKTAADIDRLSTVAALQERLQAGGRYAVRTAGSGPP